MDIIEKSKALALKQHAGLRRPSQSKQLLTEHLAEVATMVKAINLPPEAIAAAWLHDVVEDTPTTLDEIGLDFGFVVAELVDGLTDPPDFVHMPVEQRKKLQADRLKNKSDVVKIIKICDQISNVKSVLFDPPTDWNDEKSHLYIDGAKKLADICRGLRPELDNQFDELYKIALERRNK